MRTLQRPTQDPHANRQGAAAIELAIVLPVLLTIILGCVDFGRLASAHIAVTNAARVGAGFGCMHPFTAITRTAWENELRQAITDDMSDFDVDGIQVAATRSHDDNALWRVRVVVTYPFETVVDWPLLPSHLNLRRTVEIRGIR